MTGSSSPRKVSTAHRKKMSRVSSTASAMSGVSSMLSRQNSFREWMDKWREREIVLWDVTLIMGFYGVGALVYRAVEGWTFGQAFYFISSTVSTVGYGDFAPTTNVGQMFACATIVVGVTLVFTRIRKYINSIHDVINTRQRRLFDFLGLQLVDVDRLPIYRYSPADVNRILKYPVKYAFALLPLVVLLFIACGFAYFVMGLTAVQSVYFTLTTCTTVGYGDFGPADAGSYAGAARRVLTVYLLLLCILMSETVHEIILITVRKRIRSGETTPDVEDLLLRKARLNPRSTVGYSITESEYIVEALLNGNLVDRQVLLAIRRQYHWTARGGDGCRNDITAHDLFEQQKALLQAEKRDFGPVRGGSDGTDREGNPVHGVLFFRKLRTSELRFKLRRFFRSYRRRKHQRNGALGRNIFSGGFGKNSGGGKLFGGKQKNKGAKVAPDCTTQSSSDDPGQPNEDDDPYVDPIRPRKDETFEQWRKRYWDPRVRRARHEGLAHAMERKRTDPFAVDGPDADLHDPFSFAPAAPSPKSPKKKKEHHGGMKTIFFGFGQAQYAVPSRPDVDVVPNTPVVGDQPRQLPASIFVDGSSGTLAHHVRIDHLDSDLGIRNAVDRPVRPSVDTDVSALTGSSRDDLQSSGDQGGGRDPNQLHVIDI